MDEKEQLYNLLKEVFLVLDSGDRQVFSCFDLTPSRYYMLYHLAETPGLSLRQLSDRLFCDKSNVTRIFRGLEEQGLVCRNSHESDGRAIRGYLTEKGISLLPQVSQAHQQVNQSRLSCLNNEQQGNLIESLRVLKQELQAFSVENFE